jgi:RimJ/RimL family protein N-acetyltransferase
MTEIQTESLRIDPNDLELSIETVNGNSIIPATLILTVNDQEVKVGSVGITTAAEYRNAALIGNFTHLLKSDGENQGYGTAILGLGIKYSFSMENNFEAVVIEFSPEMKDSMMRKLARLGFVNIGVCQKTDHTGNTGIEYIRIARQQFGSNPLFRTQ